MAELNQKEYTYTLWDILSSLGTVQWSSDQRTDQFINEMLRNPKGGAATAVEFAGTLSSLGKIRQILYDQLCLLEKEQKEQSERRLREEAKLDEEDDRRDPIADARLAWLSGIPIGPRSTGRPEEMFLNMNSLTKRARKAVRKTGCVLPHELAAYGADRLLEFRDCGPTTVHEIRAFLQERYGLVLSG